MKYIRFKKDLTCRLTVDIGGIDENLEDADLVLVMVRPDKTRIRVPITSVEDNVVGFHISPDIQNALGVYSFTLWKNINSGNQTVCDVPNAFKLVPLSQQEGGTSEGLDVDMVDFYASFSGEFIIIDNLDSDLSDAALSAKQGNVLKGLIDSETLARKKAVKKLSKEIDALSDDLENNYQTKEDAQQEHEALQTAINDETSAREKDVAAIEEKINTKQDKLNYYSENASSGEGEYNAKIEAHNVGIIGNESVDIQAGTEMRFSGGGQAVFDGNALFEDEARFETKPIVGSATENEPVAVMSDLESKQDKLTAGTGIEITSDNVLNCTVDNNPFLFVDELPTENINNSKIYCIKDPESTDEKNIWDEYYWIESENRWEMVGKYIPTVDLTPYEKIEDAQQEHEALQTAINDETSAREKDVAAIEEKIGTKQDKLNYYTENASSGEGEYNAKINAHNVGIIGNESVDIQAGTEMRFSGGGQAVFDGNALFEDEVRFETKPIVGSATENEPVAVMSDLESKQDKLTAGTGINIDSDNVVSCTLDTSLYKIVEELPEEGDEGKIYCIKDPESTDEKNIYDEWYWTGEEWEEMGKYIPKVDLTPYETKEDAEAAHKTLQESVDSEVENRTALVEASEDDDYVMKAVDADGNLLAGFKENGEIKVPVGLSSDAYELLRDVIYKLLDILRYMNELEQEGGTSGKLKYYSEDVDSKTAGVGISGNMPNNISLESASNININAYDSINLTTTGEIYGNGLTIPLNKTWFSSVLTSSTTTVERSSLYGGSYNVVDSGDLIINFGSSIDVFRVLGRDGSTATIEHIATLGSDAG